MKDPVKIPSTLKLKTNDQLDKLSIHFFSVQCFHSCTLTQQETILQQYLINIFNNSNSHL